MQAPNIVAQLRQPMQSPPRFGLNSKTKLSDANTPSPLHRVPGYSQDPLVHPTMLVFILVFTIYHSRSILLFRLSFPLMDFLLTSFSYIVLAIPANI
jgi:hypothetical protein